MKRLTTWLAIIGLLGSPSLAVSSDLEARPELTRASTSWERVPGPPIWLPPERRPRPTVKSTALEDVVDQCVTDEMAAFDTPGAAVAVLVDGEIVYEQGYGFKERGGSDPVNAATQFRIGSITKMLTAAAVMQQVEAGTVFLDDRLTRHVPEASFIGDWPAEEITVERLLTHATGIPDLGFHQNDFTDPSALSDWVASLDWVGLHAPPGAFYNYSNPNFNLAGLVVERASGIDYRSYMHSRVFGPAGLTNTTFDPAAVVARGNASSGHLADGSGTETVYAPDAYDNGVYAPAGYAFSTAGDLVRWALLLSDGGGAVLSSESATAMQTLQQDLQTVPGVGYGYGIFVEPFYDLTIRQHGGNIWGWGSYLLWHPERRFAVAVLANTFTALPGAAYCIADELLEPDHSATPSYPADPDRKDMLIGPLEVSVNTGWASWSPYPVRGDVSDFTDDQLLLHMWDPQGPWTALWILEHMAMDVYLVDLDNDGAYDLDISFITSPGPPEQLRWMRYRHVVGTPERVPRGVGDRHP